MKRTAHYIIFAITVVLTVVCGILMGHVNVNADMTKYLPDKSQMKHGLEIVTNEFGSSAQMSGADVHVMFDHLSPKEVPGMMTLLDAYPDVRSVSYRFSSDSAHTVFDLDVPKSVDQKALGKQISNRFGGNCVVETSQDGATPPMSVMIIAAVIIMVVLFLMAQSWFEPVVILISTLMAVILNMGTNALLPSVSITTNFIGSILQAVLSLDYCIILLNRYRQEQNDQTDRETAVLAANRAIRKASPSILSSAFTTIVGLLMLCFMRLKIGADMGIVLAKGVLCSLICTFTVMPSLMLLFRKTINHTAKRIYVPPTDGLARFVTSHKVTMAICAVLLFFASWFFSRKATIFFSAEKESKIEEVFPAPNPFVLVYNTEEEMQIIPLVDSLIEQPGVQAVISYPTLLQQPLTPSGMVAHIKSITTLFADQMGDDMRLLASEEAMKALSPEIVQVLYYANQMKDEEPRITFPELGKFLNTHCANNPLFASMMDETMREQITMLNEMLEMPAPEPEPEPIVKEEQNEEDTTPVVREQPIDPIFLSSAGRLQPDSLAMPEIDINRLAVVPFLQRLYAAYPTALTLHMRSLTDTITIRMPMTVNEMSAYIGSTPTQTRLVYGYAPGKTKKMTPLQYVHLLADDLFKRKALQGMVSVEQRTMLEQRAYLMDLADRNARLPLTSINQMIRAFGLNEFSDEQLLAIAYPHTASPEQKQSLPVPPLADTHQIENTEVSADSVSQSDNIAQTQDTTIVSIHDHAPAPAPKPAVHHRSEAERQAELFTELLFGGKAYSSKQMADNFRKLGHPIDPAYVSLLYTYYGSVHSDCDTMHMSLGGLLNYVCDTLIYDQRLSTLITDTIRTKVTEGNRKVQQMMGQLRQPDHSLLVVLSSLPTESPQTYAFVDTLTTLADARLTHEHYYVGESVMYAEMRAGFDHEMNVVTLLTILAIFLIVAITFRSVIVPTILVVTVMTAVYVNVVGSAIASGQMLYLAYLIVQAILMGATIDYGILFANYYREYRRTMPQFEAVSCAYRGSIRTILTSGLIMVLGPGALAVSIDDVMISNIVGCIAVGAFVAIVLILTVVPAVLVALDRLVVYGKKNRYTAPAEDIEEKETPSNLNKNNE
ncbi:MAG: MMPL family transporter [Paludibacteraceae bacterium]|nr:MMPL family transporter [Paludibacteraceae bacterium]